jgi:hypothetical protein
MIVRKWSSVLALLIVFFQASGTPISQTLEPPMYSKLQFRQELNIYEWLYRFSYENLLFEKLMIDVKEEYSSTLQTFDSQDKWKDNQRLSVAFRYPVKKNLLFEPNFSSHLLRDPLSGFNNDVTRHSASAKLAFVPGYNFRIASQVGTQWQEQVDRSDQGLSYGAAADYLDFDLYGYRNNFTLEGARVDFPQRTNDDLRLYYSIDRQFYENTADTLTIVLDRLRRDSFDKTGPVTPETDGSNPTPIIFVRSLVQTNKRIQNSLSYRVSSDSRLLLRNSITSTTFRVMNFFEDDEESLTRDDAGFEANHALHLNMMKQRWFTQFGWEYRLREKEERRPRDTTPDPAGRHPALGFDTQEALTSFNLRSGFSVDLNDSLGLYAAVSRFKYDTSDTTNPNDHDQLRWQTTISYQHRFSPSLAIVWRASAFLNHFVYISGKFSGNNNWERIFQLAPEVHFRPGRLFHSQQRFVVRAKYQTYDFDDPQSSNRNIVNRQFVATNATVVPLTSSFSLDVTANLELSEQGRFFWDSWRQQLALAWRNEDLQILLRKRFGYLSVAAGGSFYRQIRWIFRPDTDGGIRKVQNATHENFGPIMEISYRPSDSMEFLFLGSIQIVNSSSRTTDRINNVDVNLNWFF